VHGRCKYQKAIKAMAQVPELAETRSEESHSLLPEGNRTPGVSFGVRIALLIGASLLLATGGASYVRMSRISPDGIIEVAETGSCSNEAEKVFQLLYDQCTEAHDAMDKSCAGKKLARCKNTLIHWWNTCTTRASECRLLIRDDQCSRGSAADPTAFGLCNEFTMGQIDVFESEEPVTPEVQKSYQFRSVGVSCDFGGDWCDQPIVDNKIGLSLGLPYCTPPAVSCGANSMYGSWEKWSAIWQKKTGDCLQKEMDLTGYYLTATESSDEFYIGKDNPFDGPDPVVISLTEDECPMSKTSEKQKYWENYGCRLLELRTLKAGGSYQPIPWKFSPVEGKKDQFIIQSRLGCDKQGSHCGWELSVDEIPCPKTGVRTAYGHITLEANLTEGGGTTERIHWRLLPTPVTKPESISHISGLPSGSILKYQNPPAPAPPPCEDKSWICAKYPQWGLSLDCKNNNYHKTKCQKTCELCPGPGDPPPCEDKNPSQCAKMVQLEKQGKGVYCNRTHIVCAEGVYGCQKACGLCG